MSQLSSFVFLDQDNYMEILSIISIAWVKETGCKDGEDGQEKPEP
jgi:hypothetical protein